MPIGSARLAHFPARSTPNAPVSGLKMYYEIHGPDKPGFGKSGEPLVLLHCSFTTITNNWDGWISELSKTRKVIAVEMQGHGRTADGPRDISYENLADDEGRGKQLFGPAMPGDRPMRDGNGRVRLGNGRAKLENEPPFPGMSA